MLQTKTKRENFSSVDAAWLYMDTPTNLAVITGVMTFAEPLDMNRLRATIESRLLPYDRFRMRVVPPGFSLGLPFWEIDPNFDISNHLFRVQLPEPSDHSALQRFTGKMMGTPLSLNKPLWEFYYIDNYNHGSALVGRLHHCIADGIALMQILLSMTDETPDAQWPEPIQAPKSQLSKGARRLFPIIKTVRAIDDTLQATGNMVHFGLDTIIHPSRLASAARFSKDSGLALSKLLLILPDRRTILKGKCGTEKITVWSSTIKVDEVKAIGLKMGGTINDVLLSAMTGALRRYLENHGEPVDGLDIRAVVPVNLRRPNEIGKLGNRFGLVFLSLPVGVKDLVKRLVVLRQRMDAIKNSPEALVAINILGVIGLTPVQIENIIVKIFGLKGTAVMTNVPGPKNVIFLAGKPLQSLIFWVPTPANLSLGVSILSYNGNVILGCAADAGIIPEPEKLLEAFQEEFEQMKAWGKPAAAG